MDPYKHNNCITETFFIENGQNFAVILGAPKNVCASYDDMKSALVQANNYMANCNKQCLHYVLWTNDQTIEVIIAYSTE